LREEPITLPQQLDSTTLSDLEHRRIRISGRYDYDNSIYIGPKVNEGVHGYHLVTPLMRDGDHLPILINRGFVSNNCLGQVDSGSSRSASVEVFGFLRRSPSKYWSTPSNKPNENAWYWLDTRAVLSQCGQDGDAQPFRDVYLEEVFQGEPGGITSRMAEGIPIGRAPTVDLRNTHATYAFIWFSLAALTSGMFVVSMRQRGKTYRQFMPSR